MTEREKRDLAWRLAEGSKVFDFEKALELVEFNPAEAERLIRMRKESEQREEERSRLRARRKLALREEFG
ncbi:MAG TPA: hypothetical protein VFZ29_01535 [Solirubrobacterales bacterium]